MEETNAEGSLARAARALPLRQGATGRAEEDTAPAIRRVEDDLNLPFNRHYAAALDRLGSDDVTLVFPNGVRASKTERLAGLKAPPSSPDRHERVGGREELTATLWLRS